MSESSYNFLSSLVLSLDVGALQMPGKEQGGRRLE